MGLLGTLLKAAIEYGCMETCWAAELGRMSQPSQMGQAAVELALGSLRRIWRPCSALKGTTNPFEHATILSHHVSGRINAR